MKKLLSFFALSLLAVSSVFAQDVIVMKNGEIIEGKVSEISQSEIKYTKKSNPTGPTYVVNKANVLSLKYANGEQEVFSKTKEETKSVSPEPREAARQIVSEPVNYNPYSDSDSNSDDGKSHRFRPEVRFTYDAPIDDYDSDGGGFEFVSGFQLGRHWKLGPGIGIISHNLADDYVSSIEVPIFVQGRYDFLAKKVSPYILTQIGYTVGSIDDDYWVDDPNLGFTLKFAVGVDVKLKRGRIFYDIGYKEINASDWDDNPYFLGMSIGYVWVPRK